MKQELNTPNLTYLGGYYAVTVCGAVWLMVRPAVITNVRAGDLSPTWLLAAPLVFLALLMLLLINQLIGKSMSSLRLPDLLPLFFGLALAALLFPSSVREYRVRVSDEHLGVNFITSFAHHKDARIRALAILTLNKRQFAEQSASSLIHEALLDKDPLVQQAAKLVIEDNLGIRLKNGAEGLEQARGLIRDQSLSALLNRKGLP